MHDTALEIGRQFFGIYAKPPCTIVELGSMDINGALRNVSPEGATYIGLDVEVGPGVDLVIGAGAAIPLGTDSVDIVVSSSMFEHDNFFWNTFLEMVRITRPGGTIYINSPSNGPYHRYPVDNWRFYPDSGKALESWARASGYLLTLLESFVADRKNDVWNDFVAVFTKREPAEASRQLFLSDRIRCSNVWRIGERDIVARRDATEDMLLQASATGSKGRPIGLIPHINTAFPELARLLAEPGEELKKEIRSLLQLYGERWPFDEKFYLHSCGDVAEAVRRGQIGSAFLHFCTTGYFEGRLPIDPFVDEAWYLATYADVADAIQAGLVANAAEHFKKDGYREGRFPSRAASLAALVPTDDAPR
jgi:hypothetical protein